MKSESKILDARAFGFAAAAMAALLTTVCALALVVAPEATTVIASTLIHLDLSGMSRTLSWGTYFGSLVAWTLGAGLIFWAAGRLYNRFASERTTVASSKRAFAAR
jgi:ABC-type Na+ efflux pump permease subunit